MDQSLKQYRSQDMRSAMCRACAVFLVLGSAQAGFAQQAVPAMPFAAVSPQAATAYPAARPMAEQEETAKPSKPGTEGISVHGHWVLQVKNADGTLGERREFDNSLVTSYTFLGFATLSTSGSALLAAALTGDVAVGNPAIGFISGPASSSSVSPDLWCNPTVGGATSAPNLTCYVYATTNSLWNLTPSSGSNVGGDALGLNLSVSFTPSVSFILTGNYTVPSGLSQITAVQSLYGVCAPKSSSYLTATANGSGTSYYLAGSSYPVRTADVPATSCTAANMSGSSTEVPLLGALTSTAVQNSSGAAQPLGVSPGQIVTVTLTISFS